MEYQLSISVMVSNHIDTIRKCLESVKPLLRELRAELIVLDTGSTDGSIEVAKEYTNKVIPFTWCNDFSAARNFAASKATRDWILAIDCDEYVEKFNVKALTEMLKAYPDSSAFIDIHNLASDMVNYTRSEVYRLYPKKFFHFVNAIHEQLVRIDGKAATSFHSGIAAKHYGYINGQIDLKEKNLFSSFLLLINM